ncbi:MAG: lipoate--protein ligase family protein [Acidobacteriota bacterium]|nr:lipoate--protein ligase family protein [Acidobacteriota bacterium]
MPGTRKSDGRPLEWRVLVDSADDGPHNMAVDEMLLEQADEAGRAGTATVRLYGWSPPTLTLGRNQPPGEGYDIDYLKEHGIDLVRRPTGGLSVLHDDERTFSVAGSLECPPFDDGVVATYRRLAIALKGAMVRLGIQAEDGGAGQNVNPRAAVSPVCFEGRTHHEIVAEEKKLIGVAQVRRRRAFLQHGSIPLSFDRQRLAAAVGRSDPIEGCVGIRELNPAASADDLDLALIEAFEVHFGVRLRKDTLRPQELQRVEELRAWKYDSTSWTLHGRVGRRERHWGPTLT